MTQRKGRGMKFGWYKESGHVQMIDFLLCMGAWNTNYRIVWINML